MPKDLNSLDSSSLKIFVLRSLVIICLVAACALFGTFTYLLLEASEYRNYRDQYGSIANQIDSYAKISVRNAKAAGSQLSITTGLIHDTASKWPNASNPGFQDIGRELRTLLQIQFATMLPIVYPEDLAGFEAYANSTFAKDPTVPPGAGNIPGYGFGVFKFENPSVPIGTPDRTGETSFSPYNILTPLLNNFPIEDPVSILMANLHSIPDVAFVLDSIIECVNATEPSQRNASSCFVLTRTTRVFADNEPYSYLYFPVFPHYSPDTLVGFVSIGYVWQTVLLNSLPDYVTGIDCVLCSSAGICFTYTVSDGVPKFVDAGDLHDRDYDEMRRAVKIDFGNLATPLSEQYVLYIYPSDEFYNTYTTNLPLFCTLGAVSIILITSFIFLGYDFFVKADARATKAVLESKRRFVRYISHEIRTPMNTVHLGLRVLDEFLNKMPQQAGQETNEVAELRGLTEDIREGAETAVMVVNDFLQYDNVENSTLTVDLSESDPIQFLRKSANIFELQNKESEVGLNFFCIGMHDREQDGDDDEGQEELIVLVDKIRLAQVIRNLVTNALKFSPPGSEVFVTCIKNPEGLTDYKVTDLKYESVGSFQIAVEDAGPGISRETQKKLFDDGVKFDVNELQRGQLSGLGLWISKAIVELHGGRIWADSEGIHKGAKFIIELPLLRNNPNHNEEQIMKRHKLYEQSNKVVPSSESSNLDGNNLILTVEPPSTARSGPVKVLIVEDAPSNRKMLARLLTMRGYECDMVEDGVDCVRVMQEQKEVGECTYDFIMLDYQMIHMNGPETAQRVRKLGFTSDKVKIIGVTGNVMMDDMKEFIKKGADRVMQKPFCLDTFEKEWG